MVAGFEKFLINLYKYAATQQKWGNTLHLGIYYFRLTVVGIVLPANLLAQIQDVGDRFERAFSVILCFCGESSLVIKA